jgi:predicted GH43/DUF377 family glycosyl hydrolase
VYYVCAAHKSGAATDVTSDFKNFTVLDITMPVTRNQVLFPEKINGRYYRLERPMWQPQRSQVGHNRPHLGINGPDLWHIYLDQIIKVN